MYTPVVIKRKFSSFEVMMFRNPFAINFGGPIVWNVKLKEKSRSSKDFPVSISKVRPKKKVLASSGLTLVRRLQRRTSANPWVVARQKKVLARSGRTSLRGL